MIMNLYKGKYLIRIHRLLCVLVMFLLQGSNTYGQPNLQPQNLNVIQNNEQIKNFIRNVEECSSEKNFMSAIQARNAIMRDIDDNISSNSMANMLYADRLLLECAIQEISRPIPQPAPCPPCPPAPCDCSEITGVERELIDCEDNLSIIKVGSTIGGGVLLIFIVIIIKQNLFKKSVKKIFEETLNQLRDKLIGTLIGKLTDETYKEKIEKIKKLYAEFEKGKIKEKEFNVKLEIILTK